MKKPYVAIVDDDSSFAAYLRTFLSLRGYEARCYTRGDELLASMKQSEAPGVAPLDVMMPGLDGLATAEARKAGRPPARVMMVSGRDERRTDVAAARAWRPRMTRARDHADRQVRASGHRHADARRDRRDEAGPSGEAAARSAGRRIHEAREQQAHPG